MLLTGLKVSTVLLMVAGLTQAAEEPKLQKQSAANKNQKPNPGTLLLARQGALVAMTPEGKREAELTPPKDTGPVLDARLSPDGGQVAYVVVATGPSRPPLRIGEARPPWPYKVVVQKLGAAKPTAIVDLPAYDLLLTWTPDGKRLLVTKKTSRDGSFEAILLDPITGKNEPFELPVEVQVLDWSRDGQTLLVVQRRDQNYRLGLMARGVKEMRELTELKGRQRCTVARLSPDEKNVLYIDADPTNKEAHRWGWSDKAYLLDVTAKKQAVLAGFPLNGRARGGVAWSPDGKRIAYTWKQLHPELLKKEPPDTSSNELMLTTEAFLMVADADGRNAKTVYSGRGDDVMSQIFLSLDWR